MLAAYVDTSVLLAIAFGEPGAPLLAASLARFDRLFSSPLLEAEFLAAAEREGLRHKTARLLLPISWVHTPRRLTEEIDRVLAHGYLRGADLYHLATACVVFPTESDGIFATLDRRQGEIARALGFVPFDPDSQPAAPR